MAQIAVQLADFQHEKKSLWAEKRKILAAIAGVVVVVVGRGGGAFAAQWLQVVDSVWFLRGLASTREPANRAFPAAERHRTFAPEIQTRGCVPNATHGPLFAKTEAQQAPNYPE